MTTAICPKCGSVKVSMRKNVARCQESDCGHFAVKRAFLTGGPHTGRGQHSNTHWRDPVAMSMDGPSRD